MKRVAASVLAGCLFVSPAPAMFAMVPADRVDEVPVERLLANLERNAQKLPEAERWRAIGRVHLLAYLRQAAALPVYRERPDTLAEGKIDDCATLDAQAQGRGSRDTFPVARPGERCETRTYELGPRAEAPGRLSEPRLPMNLHLAAAIAAYEKARRLEPKNLRTRVALAFAHDRAGRVADALAGLRFVAREGLRQLPKPAPTGMAMSDWELHTVLSEAQAHLALVARLKADRALAATLKRRLELAPPAVAVTPILVPLTDEASFEALVDLQSPVRFNFTGQGQAQRAGWLRPEAAWLVWDPNLTGRIRSGFQLFGSVTWVASWDNGFRALGALDDNGDGELSGIELDGLSLWHDADGDGFSDEGEVLPVTQHDIVSLEYTHVRVNDAYWESVSGVRLADGRVRPTYDWQLRPEVLVAGN
ncbi:MAG: hypothetical protein KJS87_02855 [Alphaproteobacteria bacterium]|nr:hypothetical protein [Alphaproteobacteria bacterium]